MATTTNHRRDILAEIGNSRDIIAQAAAEGQALRGELGIARQLVAMSELYRQLRAAGRLAEALAIKALAYEIFNRQS